MLLLLLKIAVILSGNFCVNVLVWYKCVILQKIKEKTFLQAVELN